MGLLGDMFWITAIIGTGGLAVALLPGNCDGIDGGCGGCDE